MAMVKTQDPYFRHAKITHDAVTSADSGDPVTGTIFENKLGCNVLKCRAKLTAGTATIRLKEYSGKLSEKLSAETWLNGAKFDISAGETTLTPAWKFDTTGAIVALFVEAIAGGNLTLEGVLASSEVASN